MTDIKFVLDIIDAQISGLEHEHKYADVNFDICEVEPNNYLYSISQLKTLRKTIVSFVTEANQL